MGNECILSCLSWQNIIHADNHPSAAALRCGKQYISFLKVCIYDKMIRYAGSRQKLMKRQHSLARDIEIIRCYSLCITTNSTKVNAVHKITDKLVMEPCL